MASVQTPLGVLEPVSGGDPIPLLKEHLVIGRRETCDIRLRFANVSAQHCELVLEQGYWKVRDLQSTNGVKVNGERVAEKRVYPGDELTISKKHIFKLEYTPTTARSADAEVDELHEDIMRFSLLERAGLTKRREGEPLAREPRRARRKPQDGAPEGIVPLAQPDQRDRIEIKPAGKSSTSLADEDQVEAITPAASAHDLSDDEFLKIVSEEQEEKADSEK